MSLRDALRRLLAQARPAADCPLPDCSTCIPTAPPLDVVAEEQRCQEIEREVGYVFWWLLDLFPEVWTDRKLIDRMLVAEKLARLRVRARAERMACR